MRTSQLDLLALAIVVIGGLNYALMGFLNVDLVHLVVYEKLGSPQFARFVYAIIGLAALYTIYFLVRGD
jgi:uncharacterized membrane protein YuzA (DUF378 family)